MADERVVVSINADVAKLRAELAIQEARLKGAGGSGTYDGMDGRVSRLEAHMEHIQEDMREVKADLKTLISTVSTLPTKSDLWTWKWQWTAIGFATMAIVIGGIVGGLSWIQPAPERVTSPQPIVITLPK